MLKFYGINKQYGFLFTRKKQGLTLHCKTLKISKKKIKFIGTTIKTKKK